MVRTNRPLSLPGRIFWVVMASLLVPLAATGGSLAFAQTPAAGENPRYGGIIRMAEREPPNLDPHLNISFLPHNIGTLIYNGLVRLRPSTAPEGLHAENRANHSP